MSNDSVRTVRVTLSDSSERDFPVMDYVHWLEGEVAILSQAIKAVEDRASAWAGLAPADDWGNDIGDTVYSDAGRAILYLTNLRLEGRTPISDVVR